MSSDFSLEENSTLYSKTWSTAVILRYVQCRSVQRMDILKYSEIHHRVQFYYIVYTFCYVYMEFYCLISVEIKSKNKCNLQKLIVII